MVVVVVVCYGGMWCLLAAAAAAPDEAFALRDEACAPHLFDEELADAAEADTRRFEIEHDERAGLPARDRHLRRESVRLLPLPTAVMVMVGECCGGGWVA